MLDTDCNCQTLGLSYVRFYFLRWTKSIHSYMFWHPIITHIGNVRYLSETNIFQIFLEGLYIRFLNVDTFFGKFRQFSTKVIFCISQLVQNWDIDWLCKNVFFYIGIISLRPPSLSRNVDTPTGPLFWIEKSDLFAFWSKKMNSPRYSDIWWNRDVRWRRMKILMTLMKFTWCFPHVYDPRIQNCWLNAIGMHFMELFRIAPVIVMIRIRLHDCIDNAKH